jgi:cytochrome c-type biogenesis protein CcmH
MILGLSFALMTAAAVFAVLWPLSRRAVIRTGGRRAVYKDQLDEIERDRAGGRIGDAEAAAARIEVSRRLLAAEANPTPQASESSSIGAWRRRVATVVALLALPVGAASLYLALGSPNLPGAPVAGRLETPPDHSSIVSLVAQVEAHLARNPEEGRGWEVLAPIYLRMGRVEESVKARRNALRLLGANAMREADLGEALVAASNGVVTAEAKGAFERALAFDAGEVKARFFMGLAAEQDGRRDEAVRIWRQLLASAPPDAPWAGLVRQEIARIDSSAALPPLTPLIPATPAPAPGPSAEEMAAAQAMDPEQRAQFVRSMVERLAERLKRDGSDVEGWLRLVRAYSVMGERDKARAAAADARRAIGQDADKLRRLDELIKGLGIEG